LNRAPPTNGETPSSLAATLAAAPGRVEETLRAASSELRSDSDFLALLAARASDDRRVVTGVENPADDEAFRDADEHAARFRHYRARLLEALTLGALDRAAAEAALSKDDAFFAAFEKAAATRT
jgi:phosphotransacetylase